MNKACHLITGATPFKGALSPAFAKAPTPRWGVLRAEEIKMILMWNGINEVKAEIISVN